jgi:hypothetical protein
MTVGTLRKLLKLAGSAPDTMRIVTHGDYLHGPEGIYDLPVRTEMIYICCAMGGCSWKRHPAPHYKQAIFWNGEE